ncbi:MAG: class I SAM-dependent methyltransferase [Gammaproteobacteria bacterium]|jgi:SAM-dependent methyltransferase|nr:class I SAM-dependent methyltransferase [Gammaproteobacteria bacterium]
MINTENKSYLELCTEFYDNDKPFANEQEVDFYGQFFTKDELLLEPMCGSGRLLIPLIKEGYIVHGLDNSPYMLVNCHDRLRQQNLQTEIFEQSITNINLAQKYDGIIIPFGSFQLLYPRSVAFDTLKKLYQHLKPSGRIVLDMFIPWEAMYLGGEDQTSEKSTVLPSGDVIVHQSHSKANKLEQYYSSHDIYEKIVNGKVSLREEETMHLCWYFIYEFELLLEKVGFKNIKRINKVINQEELMVYVAVKP